MVVLGPSPGSPCRARIGGSSGVSGTTSHLVRRLGVTPQESRVDRLAAAAEANGGDVLRLGRLVRLSAPGAMRPAGRVVQTITGMLLGMGGAMSRDRW